MTRLLLFIPFMALLLLFTACGEKQKKSEDGFSYQRTQQESSTEKEPASVPVDLHNKGIGPVTDLTFDRNINEELAAKGKKVFDQKCVICHLPDQRMIGPAPKGIYERRSPEWVMNMMLNPTEMLEKDPVAKALLIEYNNAIMLDQELTREEARALAEYFRTL